jgi:hypothetical protein
MIENSVNWLFETDTFGEDCIAQLVEEVERQGMKYTYSAKVPMRSGETYLDLFPANSCVVFYGSLGFADQIRREASWKPGVFNNTNNFLWRSYAPHFKEFLLAQNFGTYKWGELIPNKNVIYDKFGMSTDTIFMRPDSGEKPFSGKLINKEEFEKTLPKLGYEVIPDREIVIVSEPRNIELEWRFVIADRKVVTGSRYMPMWLRLTSEDRTANIFAQHVCDEVAWEPDRVWCLDICRTMAGNYYVVELNSFSCSGLYACNPKPIVENVSRLSLEEWGKIQ